MKSIFNFFLPNRCPITGQIVSDQSTLSVEGFQQLKFIVPPICEACGAPLTFTQQPCGECFNTHHYSFSKSRSILEYNETLKKLILEYKNKDKISLAPLFVKWIKTHAGDMIEEADFIIPVPLPKHRLRARMYNQAAELVKQISKDVNKPFILDAILSVAAKEQKSMESKKARFQNMQFAFQPNLKYTQSLKGKSLLVIDDVMTTGATLNGCARALNSFKPKKICVLTIGKVLKGSVL